jgi:hypothetical protein
MFLSKAVTYLSPYEGSSSGKTLDGPLSLIVITLYVYQNPRRPAPWSEDDLCHVTQANARIAQLAADDGVDFLS